uniref:Platelet-derived growth factor (PDGF) family profile domain-containing protein n=1 Tax=Cyprinus carpio TaxID=7962 RepID=A0A8C1REP3_CYPCA
EHPGPFSQVRFSAQTQSFYSEEKHGQSVCVCVCSVMLFPEAWGCSQCRSLERMVEVEPEYPGGVEHIYSPGCVPLLRCSGCCNDDKLSCFPVSTRNISIQVTIVERERERVCVCERERESLCVCVCV